MITSRDVQRVARTGSPLLHNGGRLTPEHVVRMTTSKDWIGTLYLLRQRSAQEIADQFNRRYVELPQEDQQASAPRLAIPAPRRRLELVAAT